VLFFIQPGTRQVHIAGITANPEGAWMAQQARNMCMYFADQPDQAKYLVCDRDTKFTAQFQAILESEGVEVVQTAIRAPNQNAYAERFAQTIQQECLDWFVVSNFWLSGLQQARARDMPAGITSGTWHRFGRRRLPPAGQRSGGSHRCLVYHRSHGLTAF
jgi:hypothetical protein